MVWQAEKCWQNASHLYNNINTLVKYLVVGKFCLSLGWRLANVQDQQSVPWRHSMDSSQMEHHRELLQSQKSWKWDFIRPGCYLMLKCENLKDSKLQIFPYLCWQYLILSDSPQGRLSQFQAYYVSNPSSIGSLQQYLGVDIEKVYYPLHLFQLPCKSSKVVHNFSFFLQEMAKALKRQKDSISKLFLASGNVFRWGK